MADAVGNQPPARRLVQTVGLVLYYAVASHLPDLAFPGGRAYNAVRCAMLRLVLPRLGVGNEIDGQVYVGDGSDVEIGSRCQINRACRLNRVSVADGVMIGPEVIVIGKFHRTADLDMPMVEQGNFVKKATVIEDDVWIGTRAIIMPGVRIEQGAIVGAGSVVTHDVPGQTVVAGVPARLIRRRDGRGDPLS